MLVADLRNAQQALQSTLRFRSGHFFPQHSRQALPHDTWGHAGARRRRPSSAVVRYRSTPTPATTAPLLRRFATNDAPPSSAASLERPREADAVFG